MVRPHSSSSVAYIPIKILAQLQVVKSKLQLVGCVAMMIASKYEEIYPHEVQDYVHICDAAYTAEDILGVSCDGLILGLKNIHSKHAASRGH